MATGTRRSLHAIPLPFPATNRPCRETATEVTQDETEVVHTHSATNHVITSQYDSPGLEDTDLGEKYLPHR